MTFTPSQDKAKENIISNQFSLMITDIVNKWFIAECIDTAYLNDSSKVNNCVNATTSMYAPWKGRVNRELNLLLFFVSNS